MKKWLLKKVFSVKVEVCARWNDVRLSMVRETLCVFGVGVYSRYREANYSDIERYLGI
ncbi:hypothetical protein [Ornithobacterium rhinotracheale]|uniref:Uncharacterized protein n=1 Tax=Ornithobacterium rhinotracheale (strain ATCC 51463 / DSM 15997 / CCUG 23171 / CIP 104009 / LMG 9086) TaxID=867902 RepID=I4A375_ORNRL|nr:hypothetical protein [Ornithobacterium rhinotracheale]AFL98409.1 hypothetical protein Ornrh_2278 [Ornithobacterium rhinotracheale DSM 15997]UVD87188.1 hypothetical protein NV236_11080 [Ornithobacterium rhinotracheale]